MISTLATDALSYTVLLMIYMVRIHSEPQSHHNLLINLALVLVSISCIVKA